MGPWSINVKVRTYDVFYVYKTSHIAAINYILFSNYTVEIIYSSEKGLTVVCVCILLVECIIFNPNYSVQTKFILYC